MRFPHALSAASLAACITCLAGAGLAEPVGPRLSAASNFSQGRQPGVIDLAVSLGVEDFRDGMNWSRAEKSPAVYGFDGPRLSFPEAIGAKGAEVTVVLNWGNPLYDNGNTPHTPEGIAAMGAFAAQVLETYPGIESIEVGNEFNGVNFVKGPLRDMTPGERARAYVPILASVAEAARAVRPDVRISGGATHSMAAGYLWEVLDAGGAEWLDSLAIHPYTTPAEQFVRQAAVLRRHPDATDLPIEVTEFGEPDPGRAASHFLRNYCQFALGGVTRAAWYPLNVRNDDMVPLFTKEGRITPAGRAFRQIAARMEGRPVSDAAPDTFGYGCQFGEDVLVLWGAPREVQLGPDVAVFDAEGAEVDAGTALSEAEPLVLVAPDIASKVTLGETRLVADSFHQFAYPEADEPRAEGDGFERFARRGTRALPLVTLPGQQAPSTPWFPYRGVENIPLVRLTAETLVPGMRGGEPIEIVHRYVAAEAGRVDLTGSLSVNRRSEDGVSLRVTRGEEVLYEASGTDPVELELAGLELAAGEAIELAVGPNGSPKGDVTSYRFTVSKSAD
ncbi:glycoside hydrolase family protein [Salipiger bermudensis]|uniref:glycoside hydrolase family protein n=1 Tax=Salipiger bermudensis TaxID=344736 RepID=UPI001C990DC4|nr:glycoside hydrolase family protein [Salipiger bermudensis]MBY6005216.1 glycoside hydrolase family protein [Salipiger bermudensis]